MSGIGGIIGSVVGWMGYQVGLREDSASSSGSLHAKVGNIAEKDIVANGSAIKSIQRGSISFGTSVTSRTATISEVTTGKTMLNFLGTNAVSKYVGVSGDAYPAGPAACTGHHFIRLALTNSTTITAVRAEHQSTAASISYEVIEFY